MLRLIASLFRSTDRKSSATLDEIRNRNMMDDNVCPKCKEEEVTFNPGADGKSNRKFICDKNGCILSYSKITKRVKIL